MGRSWRCSKTLSPLPLQAFGLDHAHLGDTLEAIGEKKAAIIKPDSLLHWRRGNDNSSSSGRISVPGSFCGRCPSCLVADKKPEDVEEEVPAGRTSDRRATPHAHFFITKKPKSIGFPLEGLVVTPRATRDLATQARRQTLPWQPRREDFLGRPLDVRESVFPPTTRCFTTNSSCFSQSLLVISTAHNPSQ